MRNSSQRSLRDVIHAHHRRAKRDAWAAATELNPPEEDMEEDNTPEALEMSHEEIETTASTSRRERGRKR